MCESVSPLTNDPPASPRPPLARYLSAESDTCRPVGQHHCAAENGRSVSFFPLWPPFYDSDGPGEAWNGSGRSRGPSLRPDGVRTVPTARACNPRRGKGVNWHFQMRVVELLSENTTKLGRGKPLGHNQIRLNSAQHSAPAEALPALSLSRSSLSLAWKGRREQTRSDSNHRQQPKHLTRHAERA